jgi:hypothetical protein
MFAEVKEGGGINIFPDFGEFSVTSTTESTGCVHNRFPLNLEFEERQLKYDSKAIIEKTLNELKLLFNDGIECVFIQIPGLIGDNESTLMPRFQNDADEIQRRSTVPNTSLEPEHTRRIYLAECSSNGSYFYIGELESNSIPTQSLILLTHTLTGQQIPKSDNKWRNILRNYLETGRWKSAPDLNDIYVTGKKHQIKHPDENESGRVLRANAERIYEDVIKRLPKLLHI